MENRALGKAPVGDIAHFNERRGFERLYHQNPHAQERGAMFLVGFLALHQEFGNAHDRSPQVAAALKTVLRDFVTTFPEFMGPVSGDYAPNESLVRAVNDSLSEPE